MKQRVLKRGERVLKAGANLNRLRILDFVQKANHTSVWAISQNLGLNLPNVSQHLLRLEKAGLVEKHSLGVEVCHQLTPYGEAVLKFIDKLE